MIINPNKIIKNKIILNFCEKAIQPNSIDLRIKNIAEIQDGGYLLKDKKLIKSKKMPQKTIWKLKKGKAYDIEFEEYVKIPKNIAAFITHRSTLNRMGAFIMSGIYDSGFENYVGAILRTNTNIKVGKGVRIATIFFVKADSCYNYQGQYQKKII